MTAVAAPAVQPKSWHWSSIPKGMGQAPLAVGCAVICFMLVEFDRDLSLSSNHLNIGLGCFNSLFIFDSIRTENQKMTAKARVDLILRRVLTSSSRGESERTMLSEITPDEAFRYNQVRWRARTAAMCDHLLSPSDENLAFCWFGLERADLPFLDSHPVVKGATFTPTTVKALFIDAGWRVEVDQPVEAAVLMTALKMVRSAGPHKVDLEDALQGMDPSEVDRRGSRAALYANWLSTTGNLSVAFGEAPEVAANAVALLKRGGPATSDRERSDVAREIWKSRWNLTREEGRDALLFDLNKSLARRPYHTTKELSITNGAPAAQEVSLSIALESMGRDKDRLTARGLLSAQVGEEEVVDPRFVVLASAFAKGADGKEVNLNDAEAIKAAMPAWCTPEARDLAPAAIQWFRERA